MYKVAVSISDEMYCRIVEAVPEGIWVVDSEGNTIFSNRRMAEILGIDFESMAKQSCFDCVFPDELADAQRHFARATAGDNRPFDFRLRRGDGSPIWVSICCMLVRDRQQTAAPLGLLGLFSDISERKQAESALRESEERFRLMIDAAPVMVWVSGPDKLCTYFNRPWLDFTGRPLDQELGNGWASGVHPEDLDRCLANYSTSFDARRDFRIEYRLRRADGEHRWVLDTGTPFYRNGEFGGYIGSCIDITEQKRIARQARAEAALRKSEERLRLAARAARFGIYDVDLVANTAYWSPEFRDIVGVPMDAPASPHLVPDFIHPEDRGQLEAMFSRVLALEGEGTVLNEHRIIRPGGSVRWVQVRGQVQFGGGGESSRAVRNSGVLLDITERKLDEERWQRAQKLESVGFLAGGIAHDFNNLLTGIMGHASLVLDDIPPCAAESIRAVIKAAERAAQLTRQLLAYAGKGQFIVRDIDVSQAVQEIADLVQFSIPKSVQLSINVEKRLPLVRMDPGQLQQILMNLVINAGEAIGEGVPGRIMVGTSMREVENAFTDSTGGLVASGRYVCIEISDTGAGIGEEDKEKIFEPFFTTKFTGRGLGLAAVAGILRSQRGGITLETERRSGSSFRVFLPAHENPVRTVAPLADTSARGTVLVVDDESTVRDFIGSTLRRNGYRVLVASDGSEALSICESSLERIDAMILDTIMPVMGANELLPLIPRLRPNVRVLLTSGYNELEARRLCADYPGADFIGKPYTAQQISKALEKLLGRSSVQTEPVISERSTVDD